MVLIEKHVYVHPSEPCIEHVTLFSSPFDSSVDVSKNLVDVSVENSLPMCFMTLANCLSWILTLEIVVETNACGFWSNSSHDFQQMVLGLQVLSLKLTRISLWGILLDTKFNTPHVFHDMQ